MTSQLKEGLVTWSQGEDCVEQCSNQGSHGDICKYYFASGVAGGGLAEIPANKMRNQVGDIDVMMGAEQW